MPSLDASALRAPRPQAVTLDVGTILAGVLAIVAGLAAWRHPALNEALFHAVNDLGPAAPVAWSCLSVAGLGLSAWIYLAAFAERRPERAAQLLWILVAGGLVIHFIKHWARSPRPLGLLGDAGVNVVGEALRTQSMPSGHSAMAFALLALLVAERRRFDERGAVADAWLGRLGFGVLALFALGIALSRLAVGAHWPADALVGGGLGLVFGALAPHAWPVATMVRLLSRPLGQRLMAAGFVASAIAIGATPDVLQALGLADTKFAHQVATGYPLAAPLQLVLAATALAGAWRWGRASAGAA